ncbi:alpha/beta fold hydrolase [Wenzhouxiangella sp. AB-CW3]|uniref:alpha/beta hydrolase n=1 Tax=Wenzhouxiangella sp. AB-CW3 TaxID=2771012 RepID=UPI00168AA362|nr:alpha/beta fold hydrolase [Wenzhouxiangella sp. AB-CW3]QOC22528.1 alpha/beta fold hydrolase [Wenzhouxiangella sp. AB-CW3]
MGLLLLPGSAVLLAENERWDGLENCEISIAGGRLSADALCGTLPVAENPAAPEGRQIDLAFAVSPARASRAEPDPVVFLAGGPGQSARDLLPVMKRTLRDVNRDRDLVFVDQRGTGGSNALDCEAGAPEEMWMEVDGQLASEYLRDCMREWDADLRFYTTSDGAADLEHFREHFAFDQLNLVGGSYGTRMAQVYLRNYPDRVRSVILDGVVPVRLHLGSEHGLMLDRALERIFAACNQDPACSEHFPDLEQAFADLKARYRNNNQSVFVTHPRTGRGFEMEFNRDVLASALRFLAYGAESQMMIPYLVHEAASSGSPERLASQALIVTDRMMDMMAVGLNFSVGCSEDWPGWPRDIDQSHTLLGDSLTEAYDDVCEWWPAGDRPDDFHQPFESDVPALLMSGELDPVTPPSYGDEALEQYPNGKHLVASGRGHIVLTNRCMSRIATEFIRTHSVDELDTDCMSAIGPEPFFLDLLGPAP